jgi:hypothetical protein
MKTVWCTSRFPHCPFGRGSSTSPAGTNAEQFGNPDIKKINGLLAGRQRDTAESYELRKTSTSKGK